MSFERRSRCHQPAVLGGADHVVSVIVPALKFRCQQNEANLIGGKALFPARTFASADAGMMSVHRLGPSHRLHQKRRRLTTVERQLQNMNA